MFLSCGLPTSWIPSQDQFADLIVNEDDQTVGEGAEPPHDSKRKKGRKDGTEEGQEKEMMAERDDVSTECGSDKWVTDKVENS